MWKHHCDRKVRELHFKYLDRSAVLATQNIAQRREKTSNTKKSIWTYELRTSRRGRRWAAAGFAWQAQYRELPGCLPTSLYGVLVFRLDPAGATSSASPSAASSSSLITQSLTHSQMTTEAPAPETD